MVLNSWRRRSTALTILAGCAVAALLYRFALVPAGPARAVVEPPSQRITAASESSRITARHQIHNTGGQDLILGEVETTCGCGVASIEPKIVQPGRHAEVTVRGAPPGAGEKTVEIRVQTNADDQAPVSFFLTMVGAQVPPYVAVDSGPVRFGINDDQPAGETIVIETRERADQAPWLAKVATSDERLSVTGGLEDERSFGGDVVLRRYNFTAQLQSRPEPGEYRAEIQFGETEGGGQFAPRLPVLGTVRPPLFAAPSSVYMNITEGDASAGARVSLVSDDPTFDLSAELEPLDSETPLTVTKLATEKGRVIFRIAPASPFHRDVSSTLIFRTNHPLVPRFELPVAFAIAKTAD